MTKFEYGICLAAALGYLMIHQQDPVGLVTFDTKIQAALPPKSKRTQLGTILAILANLKPAGQTDATIDVDIVSTPSNRIIASELDFGGVNFRVSYTDDGGKTWTQSTGAELGDTDRQWLAVGPSSGESKQYPVYLMFHNLVSGTAARDRKALIREIQRHPVAGLILHLDLQHISLTERITVEVPIVLIGTPIGVKDGGGILEHLLREVEVECLPTDIPSKLEVDVSALQIGDSLHVSDIKAERAEILTEADRAIAAVVPPTVLEEVKPAEEAVAAEPEVIGAKEEEETEEGGKEGGKEGKEGKEGPQGPPIATEQTVVCVVKTGGESEIATGSSACNGKKQVKVFLVP